MKPSVGRIVHYVSYGTPGGEYKPACRAAVITEVTHDEPGLTEDELAERGFCVGLCVLNPTGQFFNREIGHDPGQGHADDSPLCGQRIYHGGSWHWPERV